MKKVFFIFILFSLMAYVSFAQTESSENPFKGKNTLTVGFNGLVLPQSDFESGELSGYAGLSLSLEHAVGSHFAYALNANTGTGPTYDYDATLIPIYRTRIVTVGPEFRAYTQARQRGFYMGLGLNYVQQHVLISKLANTDKNLDLIQGGLNLNLSLGFQSQITPNLYTRFHTGLGIMKVGNYEYGNLVIPINLGIGYRF